MAWRARVASAWVLVASGGTLAGASACGNILGLGDIQEATCVGAGCDGGDATASEGGDEADSGGEAEACSPVTVLDPATIDAAACPPSDGGCAPAPFDAAAIHWVPSRVQPGACTEAQIQNFYTSCISPSATVSACDAFQSTYAACSGCLTSNVDDPSYGTLVDKPFAGGVSYTVLNTADCIEATDSCNEPCARVREGLIQCVIAACAGSCSVLGDFQACVQHAADCGICSAYFYSAHDCALRLIAAKSPAHVCVMDQGSFEADLLALGGATCVMP